MSLAIQEILALSIVALAALYMVAKLTGWPRLGVRKKACASGGAAAASANGPGPVILGDRLRRGMERARGPR